jgi:hypothetical protein
MLILAFLTGGQVALEEDGEQVWSSDSDDEFLKEFGDAFHDPADAEEIIEYLTDSGIVEEDEADEIEVESESLDATEAAREAESEDATH